MTLKELLQLTSGNEDVRVDVFNMYTENKKVFEGKRNRLVELIRYEKKYMKYADKQVRVISATTDNAGDPILFILLEHCR